MAHTPIIYDGRELLANFDYQPAEKATQDYPGCHEELIIYSLIENGKEVIDEFTDCDIDNMTNHILTEKHTR